MIKFTFYWGFILFWRLCVRLQGEQLWPGCRNKRIGGRLFPARRSCQVRFIQWCQCQKRKKLPGWRRKKLQEFVDFKVVGACLWWQVCNVFCWFSWSIWQSLNVYCWSISGSVNDVTAAFPFSIEPLRNRCKELLWHSLMAVLLFKKFFLNTVLLFCKFTLSDMLMFEEF